MEKNETVKKILNYAKGEQEQPGMMISFDLVDGEIIITNVVATSSTTDIIFMDFQNPDELNVDHDLLKQKAIEWLVKIL